MKITDYNFHLWGSFKDNFGSIEFKETKPKLETRTLHRNMLDKDILSEFKPKECTLGDLVYALKNPKKVGLLENGYANIFYIRDAKGTLWAVRASWHAVDRGWLVFAHSVSYPVGWLDGSQVVSRKSV